MTNQNQNQNEKKRAIIIAAFGDRRREVQRLIKNIRCFVDYPIIIIQDEQSNIGAVEPDANVKIKYVERVWQTIDPRSGVRNSNYFKIKTTLDCYWNNRNEFDSVCLLDDDMFILNENFIDGFAIAERFGAALPLNPRTYVKYNAMGADVQQKDLDEIASAPQYAPACNFSPFFISIQHATARNFALSLIGELRDNVCRGTLAVWKASWESRFMPVLLPEQWCICGEEAQYIKDYTQQLRGQQLSIEPIMLHLGHQKTCDVFKDEIERLS